MLNCDDLDFYLLLVGVCVLVGSVGEFGGSCLVDWLCSCEVISYVI